MVQYWFAETVRLIRRWFQPTGFWISVLGPDGVGKSTLIRELVPQVQGVFRRTKCFHWRPGTLWPRKTTGGVTDPHGQAPHGLSGSIARLFAHFLDCCVGYGVVLRPLLARSGLVIFDRYFPDVLADPVRYRYRGPLWLARALYRIMPKPDLILVLDAPEDVILSRKQEVARKEVRSQRQVYRLLVDAWEAEVVDTSQPCAQSAADASRVVTGYLARRFRKRYRRWIYTADRQLLQTALIRLFGRPTNGPAHTIRHRFAVLPCGSGPRCLLPLADTRTILKAAEINTPYALRSRVLKGVLVGCIKTGWKRWARDRLLLTSAAPFPLEDLLGEITGDRGVVFSLSLGTSPRYRKLTAQVMRPGGGILGYVKLSLTEEATARVRHEATILKRLWEFPAMRPYIPKVLQAGDWHGGYLVFLTPGLGRPGPAKFTEPHERFLQNLNAVCSLEKTGRALVEDIALAWQRAATLLDTEWQDLGKRAIEKARRDLNGTTIRCGLIHGDFAPWNTRVEGSHLFVFDWESAAWETPSIWDYFHFRVQVASLLRNPLKSTGNLARKICADSATHPAVLLLYLLTSVASIKEDEYPQPKIQGAIEYRKNLVVDIMRLPFTC